MASEIPVGWPPEPGTSGAREAPMFPLPNVFLAPGIFMPLHIFEERYRQMVEDSLDGPGRIVMATVLSDFDDQMKDSPPVHHIAGLGEIVQHERLRDGRFMIGLVGLARVKIREVHSDRLYRRVLAEPLLDATPPKEACPAYRERLEQAILQRTTEILNLPDTLSVGHLTDLLLMQLRLPQERMLELYSEPDIARRAEGALHEHSQRPFRPKDDEGPQPPEPREML